MKVTKFAIDHATTVYVLIFIIIVGGLISYSRLPREAAPDIAIPIVIVSTPYFGVSPADMEELVTRELEQEFKGLRSLKKMNSTSAESVSLITLEFEPDVVIEDALQKVRDKVDKAKPDLPPDAEEPEIIEVNASDWPVLIANVSGDMDQVRLKELAEDMKEDIEKIPDVLRVDIAGGVEREIQILVDPARLRHHKVSLNQVIGKLQAENVNLPGGSIDLGSMKYTVRVPGEFESVQMIEELVIKAPDGDPVYLRDVATVKDGFEEPSTRSRLTTWGDDQKREETVTQTNVSLSVVKRAGENIIDVAERSKKVIRSYEERVPAGVNIVIINDMSVMIKERVHELENNIISGLILVLGVLFFFMGGARNALFVAISIPLSMLVSFLVLSMLGITLNMVVLFSLVLALGMLVDNAIVIVENIYRHASEGKPRAEAALSGTIEVGWAVIASTATTVAAFFPMLFWPGVTGKFMGFLPKTVIITLLSSLFVALVINPTLCATLLKVKEGVSFSQDEVPDIFIYRLYRRTLEWALDYRLVVVLLAIGSLAGTFFVFSRAELGVEFFPDTTPERFEVAIEMPDGTRLEETDDVMRVLEAPIDARPELVDAWIGDVGVKAGRSMGGSGKAPHYGKITVDLSKIENQPSDPFDFMEWLREQYKDVPGASIVLNREKMGPPAGKPVNIEIVGEDLAVMSDIARRIKQEIRGIPGIIDLNDDIELTRPEVHVVVDRERAAIVGVDTRGIAQTVRTAINGTDATVFREGDEEYDVVVRLPEEKRQSIEDLETLTVVNKDKFHIPITEVASIQVRGGTGSIRHKDQDRVVTVSANAADGYLPAKLLAKVQEGVEEMELPSGYTIRYTGENEDQAEAAEFLGFALLAALFLIALILVTEFNSIVQPIIILLSVLLSLIGVLWSLILAGEPFGIIMTGIGIISLAGVVVNNSIVLIDYANQLRERGDARRDAVVKAGLVRFRPVMLTAVTTILGLLPLVVGVSLDFVNTRVVVGGSSVEMWGPMARVVSAGLLVATVLTLVVVPVLYSLLDDVSGFFKRVILRRAAAGAALLLFAALPWSARAQQPPPKNLPAAEAEAEETAEESTEEESTEEESTEAEAGDDNGEFRRPEDVGEPAALRGEGRRLEDFDIGGERVLALDEALDLVEKENLDVKQTRTQIAVADSYIRQAYATLFPTFRANASYTVNEEEVSFNPAEGSPLPPDQQPDPVIVVPKTDYQWSVSGTLSFNARAIGLLKQAYTQHELAETRIESVAQQVQLGVIRTYYSLLTIRQVMLLAQEQYDTSETLLNATEGRIRAGTATEFELTRARLRVVQAEKEVERARLQFIQVREQLARLLQTEADFDVAMPDVEEDVERVTDIKEDALVQRDDIAVARLDEEIADYQLEEIYWKYVPTLAATFTYSGVKDTAFSPGAQWRLVLSANWLIWDGGTREAELDRQEAMIVARRIETEKRKSQVMTDIETAYADYLSSLKQVESGEAEVELAAESLRQAQIAYKYGAATQLDVITAEDQYNVSKISLIQDLLAVELAVMRLRNLSGESM